METANLRLKKNLLLLGVLDAADLLPHACVFEAAIYTKYNGAFKPSPAPKSPAALRIESK